MSALASLFGDTLQTKNGILPVETVLAGKTKIGIYFSASWCGPCHAFTPVLAKAYKELVDGGESGFEVVFVSADRNTEAFDKYYDSMPWAAIPYDKLDGLKDTLDEKFEVGGIPTLAVVDQDGNVIRMDSRGLIDKFGSKAFPFSEEHIGKLQEAAKEESNTALQTLASSHLPTVFGSGAEVVCLVLGSPGQDVGFLKDCLPDLADKPFKGFYIPWTDKEDDEGHTKAACGFEKLAVSEQEEQVIAKVVSEPVEPPQLLVLAKKDGKWEVGNIDAFTLVRKFGARGYPWNEARAKECEAEDKAKLEEMRGSLGGLKLLNKDGNSVLQRGVGGAKTEEKVDDVAARSEIVGIYFSAHWCPPCRRFTPMLITMYEKLKAMDKKFEVVFVSSDKDQAAFDEYFGSMPWLALAFSDRALKGLLGQLFEVRGIPSFVLIDVKQGKVLEVSGRQAVEAGAGSWPFDQASLDKAMAERDAASIREEEEGYQKQEAVSGAKMVLKRKSGEAGGCKVDPDTRAVSCMGFFTMAAEGLIVPKGEKAYYELEITKCESICQVGWATPEFAPNYQCGDGVGDCDKSWGVDGIRQNKWHNGAQEFGSQWKAGDVLGLILDLSPTASSFSASLNGDAGPPNGTAFSDLKGIDAGVYPALTLTPGFEAVVNFGEKPFKFTPPAGAKPLSAFA
mmetsp:Transcript_43132/g.88271  ORF Transcript_43132/g.88271 Transcript_43132/m.88271 type:complete len:677 (+) Transcript_43132:77-2107(+)